MYRSVSWVHVFCHICHLADNGRRPLSAIMVEDHYQPKFLSWSVLEDPEYGYIKDGKITIEVEVTAV